MRRSLMKTLLLLFLLFPISLFSQAWLQLLPLDGSGSEDVLELCALPGGGFAAAGIYTGSSPFPGGADAVGQSDIFLVYYDEGFNLKWQLTTGNLETDEVTGLAVFPNGDLAVAGAFWFELPLGDTLLDSGSSVRSLFIARLRPDGSLVWADAYPGDGLKNIADVRARQDGSLAIAGYFQNDLQFRDSLLQREAQAGSTSLFVASLGGNGELEWVRQAGQTGDTRIAAMGLGPDGSVLAGGNFNGTFSLAGTNFDAGFLDTDVFVAAYSASGEPLWARDAGGVVEDQLRALAVDSSGNCYISGDIVGVMNVADTLVLQSSTGNSDVFLIKYRPDGTPAWASAFGGADVQTGNSLAVSNETVVVGGSFQGPIAYDNQSADTGDMDVAWGYLTGFSTESGAARWLEVIPTNDLGLVRSLSFLPGRSLLAAGLFGQNGVFDGQSLEATGNFSAFVARRPARITPVRGPVAEPLSYTLYPNPTSGAVQLSPYTGREQLQLLDAAGQKYPLQFTGGQFSIEHLPNGLYYLQVSRESKSRVLPVVKH